MWFFTFHHNQMSFKVFFRWSGSIFELLNSINQQGLSWFFDKPMVLQKKFQKKSSKNSHKRILNHYDDFWRKPCRFLHLITIICVWKYFLCILIAFQSMKHIIAVRGQLKPMVYVEKTSKKCSKVTKSRFGSFWYFLE